MVGTSGSALVRLAPNKASGLALPALIWLRQADTDDTSTCALLPRKEVSAGPPPLVGRWRSFKPPRRFHVQRHRDVQRAVQAGGRER